MKAPQICPTCGASMAFVKVDREEALRTIGDHGDSYATVENVIAVWREFAENNPVIKMNPNEEEVNTLASGVLENVKNRGMKYCPCRMTSGDFQKDLELVCPCNFYRQKVYKENGECWCGLFMKR
jgi:ferredoxin-thioredoxin reductase catalytic chain